MFKLFFWAFIEKGGIVFLQFISLIILGRLLSPNDYGIYGIMMVFISIAELLVDSGFGGALVQKKDLNQSDINTLFVTNVSISLILYGLIFLISPLVANFYSLPQLSIYLRILGLVVIFYSLSIVHVTLLQRELRLRESAIVVLVSTLISVCGAIILALVEFGIWALISQQLLFSIVCISLFYFRNFRRIEMKFSYESFKILWEFGSKLLFTNLICRVYSNICASIIPKIASMNIAGLYFQASKMYAVPENTLVSTIDKATFPILSKENNLKILLEKARNINRVVCLFVFPLFLILSIYSSEIINLILGEKWSGSSTFLSILSMGGIGATIQALYRNIFKSCGDVDVVLKVDTIKILIGIIMLFISIKCGLYFLVYTIMINSYIGGFIYSIFLCKKYSFNFIEQLKDFYVPLLTSISLYFIFINLEFIIEVDVHYCLLSVLYYLSYLIILMLSGNKIILNYLKVILGL